jgi:hypothetical protein
MTTAAAGTFAIRFSSFIWHLKFDIRRFAARVVQ